MTSDTAENLAETPQQMIERLRSDPAEYARAAQREGEVWGEKFSNAAQIEVRKQDQEAATALGKASGQLSIYRVAKEEGWQFDRGLSLACGSGRAERRMIASGVCRSFLGIDIAEGALEEGRRQAENEGLSDVLTYEYGDLNTLKLPENEFDLVVTQSCLHHILELEHLAEQIWRSLKPGGRVWIHDFIGETQFQWTDKRLTFLNAILDALPEVHRLNRLTGARVKPYFRRPVGELVSPFEAIRSAEIIPVFTRWFEIERRHESDSFMHLLSPVGTRASYAETEAGRDMFKMLMTLDKLLIETGTLPPLAGQYVLRRRETPVASA